jgi:hypothetical protein
MNIFTKDGDRSANPTENVLNVEYLVDKKIVEILRGKKSYPPGLAEAGMGCQTRRPECDI